MGQFEQDWLELGRRVACSLHYQHPRNLRLLQAAKTEPRLATASTTMATHSSLESSSQLDQRCDERSPAGFLRWQAAFRRSRARPLRRPGSLRVLETRSGSP
jgi:hypothetical protein